MELKYSFTQLQIGELKRKEVRYVYILSKFIYLCLVHKRYVEIKEVLQHIEDDFHKIENVTIEEIEDCIELYLAFGMAGKRNNPIGYWANREINFHKNSTVTEQDSPSASESDLIIKVANQSEQIQKKK